MYIFEGVYVTSARFSRTKALRLNKKNKKQKERKKIMGTKGRRRRTKNSALGIESSETGAVPRVRLESVVRRISQAVRPTSQDLVNYEGTFPLGLEFVLFLVRQA